MLKYRSVDIFHPWYFFLLCKIYIILRVINTTPTLYLDIALLVPLSNIAEDLRKQQWLPISDQQIMIFELIVVQLIKYVTVKDGGNLKKYSKWWYLPWIKYLSSSAMLRKPPRHPSSNSIVKCFFFSELVNVRFSCWANGLQNSATNVAKISLTRPRGK